MENGSAKQKKSTLNIIFAIFFVMIIFYLILGQIFTPRRGSGHRISGEMQKLQWVRILPDGTREPVILPQKFDAERGEKIVLEALLPREIAGGTWIVLNSLRQEIEIDIDGKLRQKFSTRNTGASGKYSTTAYVFEELHPQDAGKTLKIT